MDLLIPVTIVFINSQFGSPHMVKWKKIIAVSVVLIMLASAGTVYYLYDQGFFGPTYGDMDGYYFDFEGSSEIGLCNVEMGETEITNAGILDTISLASNSVEQAGTSVSKNHRPVSHDNYLVAPSRVHSQLKNVQSKLFFDDEHGNHKIAKAYLSSSDMKNKTEHVNYKQSIVYVADAGQFILITYYKHNMSDVYNHLNYHGSFWSADRDYASALIEKDTGLVHKLSGLWCGCTYGKYAGTNDIMPSIEYVGEINGEDAFLINLERRLVTNNNNPGMFHDKRGLITIGLDQEGQITYKELVTERNAGVGVEYDDDGNRITVYDDGQPILGKEFEFYKNGIIHYYEMYSVNSDDHKSGDENKYKLSIKHYLYFTETGEKRAVDSDKIIDVDGYLCSSAEYRRSVNYDRNMYWDYFFPVSCVRYCSDGSEETVVFDDQESYRISSEQHYYNCIYRNIGETSTELYLAHKVYDPNFQKPQGEIDRITLYPDGTFSKESRLFNDYLFEFDGHAEGIVIYDHRIFGKFCYESSNYLNIRDNMASVYLGYIIYDDNLICISDDKTKLEYYNLTLGTMSTKSFSETGEILYIYVDYDGRFVLEGTADKGYTRGTMQDDGSFKFKKTDLELDVVKKVKTS